MLDVGLIGPGPDWETAYRPVLQKLSRRIRVRAVYSPVNSLADQLAAEFHCDQSLGLFALVERPDVQALLLLDSAWFEQPLIEFACRHAKPMYLAGRICGGKAAIHRLHLLASENGITLMSPFRQRYLPSTVRLQELIATRLGRPTSIQVHAALPATNGHATPADQTAESDLLLEWLDWCRYLIVGAPGGIHSTSETVPGDSAMTRRVRVDFRRGAGNEAPEACIHLRRSKAAGAPHAEPVPLRADFPRGIRCEIECQKGRAVVEGPAQITWSVNGEQQTESLGSERSEFEVMLDHFCRRVVGGLIPVPTLEDMCDTLRLVQVADESHQSGMRVGLEQPPG